MDRSYASGAAGSAPAAPASPSIGYPTAGNPGTGTPATKPGPYWYHQITEELLAIISAAGITPAQGTLTQLASAIQSGKLFSSAAGGTPDALTASFVPTVSSLINGMSLYVRAGSANVTTTPTFTPASGTIAAKTIVKGAGGTLSAGDIAGGGHWIELQYDQVLDKWVLLNPATGIMGSSSGTISVSFRNRIINGDMRIDQRNAGVPQTFTAAAAVAYCVDRFYASCSGANVVGQRVAGSGSDQYLYQFTGAVSVTSILFGQRIEATNIYDLANTTCSFSVELSNSALTSVVWTAYYPTSSDNYTSKTQIATGSFSVNSTLAKYAAQISLPSGAQNGLCIELSVAGQTSGTWKIGQFQFESGSNPSAFERRHVWYELGQCQRYYEKSYEAGVTPGSATRVGIVNIGALFNASAQYLGAEFKVPKRIAPSTMSYWDGGGNPNKACYNSGGTWYDNGIVVAAYNTSTRNFYVSCSGQSGYAQNFLHFNADAEL